MEAGPVPPEILGLSRSSDRLFPSSESTVSLSAVINSTNNPLNTDSLFVYYSKNNEAFVSTKLNADGAGYTAEIPAMPDNSVVRYYAIAIDKKGISSRFPLSGTLHYVVKDGTASIAEILNPAQVPNSQMARNNLGVSVEGVVTTDTNDIRFGVIGRYITIQDSQNPFSALQVSAFNPLHPIYEFKRGDKVKISGKFSNTNNGWSITSPTEFELLTQNNQIEPIILHADSLGKANAWNSAMEQWRGMLVEVKDLIILDTNAKNGRNTGAFAVASSLNPLRQNAFNIETNIGMIKYTTFDTLRQVLKREKPIIGYKISWVRGILSSNNQTYTIVPRTNDDFGIVATIFNDAETDVTVHPNPTSTSVTLPFEITQNSKLVIVNSIGKIVDTRLLNEPQIIVNSLPVGQYFAYIVTANGEYKCRFNVMK